MRCPLIHQQSASVGPSERLREYRASSTGLHLVTQYQHKSDCTGLHLREVVQKNIEFFMNFAIKGGGGSRGFFKFLAARAALCRSRSFITPGLNKRQTLDYFEVEVQARL